MNGTMKRLIIMAGLLVAGLACGPSNLSEAPPAAAVHTTPAPDSVAALLFDQVMAFARNEGLHEQPVGMIMTTVGRWFERVPYAAGTLDANPVEQLVVKLDGFDCVTFVESMLALARGIRRQDYSYETFAAHLLDQRYRGSKLDGYCSRLHYFSEWIADNESRGNVVDITERLGGERLEKRLNFMSRHRESYPHLAHNDSLLAGIVEIEHRLEGLPLHYIPQDRIRSVYPLLESGDIIALATDIEGLDVVHTGLAYRFEDGMVGLLHASTTQGVTVSPDLQAYVENNRRQIGIVVARPRESVD